VNVPAAWWRRPAGLGEAVDPRSGVAALLSCRGDAVAGSDANPGWQDHGALELVKESEVEKGRAVAAGLGDGEGEVDRGVL
jgi:hypothetical protein